MIKCKNNHDTLVIYNGVYVCGGCVVEEECNGSWETGSLQHDGDTCPIHEEDLGARYRDKMQEEWPPVDRDFVLPEEFHPYFSNEPLPESVVENQDVNPINATIDLLFAKPGDTWENSHVTSQEIPTLRNESNVELSAPTRKENKMESILRDLREKYDEASGSKEQLEEFSSTINDALEELETYLSDLDDLIASLDQLPEVSVYVELDTVSFDS